MLDVSYEDVVDDLEGQARRLIDYCGLPWDDRCLSFHKTSRPVKPPVPFRSATPVPQLASALAQIRRGDAKMRGRSPGAFA
jgi:hypothetical protein